jgi:hypothetical protein
MGPLKNTCSVITLILCMAFSSCIYLSSGSYWTRFEKNKQVSTFSDQGPWGGTLIIKWCTTKSFKDVDIISYAENHGWKFADSITPAAIRQEFSRGEEFPEWKNTAKAYLFTTGQLQFESGTDISTDTTGLILLSSDGRNLVVYHIWGE